jgi:fatty acid desaturase
VPLNANRQFHLTHHGYAHQPGHDPERAMHERPFWLAATVGSFIGIREQYKLFFASVRRITHLKYTRRVLSDAFFVVVAATFYFGLVPALGIPVSVSVVPMLLVFPLVFSFRALSDHYGLPATLRSTEEREDILDSDEGTWTAGAERRAGEVSGWVVTTAPWLEWLWSHANYHEVHHKFPHLSHRYLPRVFELTRARYPYYVAGGYWRSILTLRRLRYDSEPEELRAVLGEPLASPAPRAAASGAGR